ncbi:hypothetical protein GALMADRAFT_143993 [Galerina marginata CBS 339.88]|uniref:Uncharacterized protein n=1 Tax=Galerina marginata (strain CBS 339.88) TaxID=685588 RepID=A0A067SUA9_GALM3|nr:hypothetical protein GALMADRAFT_143993 [Galerina marginata CBS 339.88]
MDIDFGIIPDTQILECWFNGNEAQLYVYKLLSLSQGFYSALVLSTVWVIVSRTTNSVAKKCIWVALTLSMYISSTIHCSLNWNHLVNSAKESVGGNSTGFSTALLHPSPKVEIVGASFFAFNIAMADLILAWRCWIVWQRRWYFAVIPVCGSITGIVLAGLAIHSKVVLQEANVAVNVIQQHSRTFVSMSNAFFSLSIATSLTATVLISLRIFLSQRAFRKAGLKFSYNSVIEIVVESAALYSITLLLFVIFESQHNALLYYPQEIHAQVSGIAPTLIVLRVASGNSRPESDWDSKQSALRFTAQSENDEQPVVENV